MEIEVTTKLQKVSSGTLITSIPKAIVERLGLKQGDTIVWNIEGNRATLGKKR